jgi:hypothetical protein
MSVGINSTGIADQEICCLFAVHCPRNLSLIDIMRKCLILLKHNDVVFFQLGKGEIFQHGKTNISIYRGVKTRRRGPIT